MSGYTRRQLVEEALKAGFKVSDALIADWVEQGLLGKPARMSRGKGKGPGARYEWSEAQCRLLLLLLDKRKTLPAIGGLCDIPVGFWLYWAVDWIEVEQVKRALPTWWKRASSTNEDKSLEQARKFVRSYVPKGAPRAASSALRDELQDAMRSGSYDRDRLKELAEAVLARGGQRPKVPYQKDASGTVDDMLSMVTAMTNYGDATTGDFVLVRARLRRIAGDYVRDWHELRQGPGGAAFEAPSWEFFTTNSCRHLITGIGQQLRAKHEGWRMPPIEPVPPNSIPYEFQFLPIRVQDPLRRDHA